MALTMYSGAATGNRFSTAIKRPAVITAGLGFSKEIFKGTQPGNLCKMQKNTKSHYVFFVLC
jgi:hypothetical protein